ncbi:remorin family protein [Tasmannia lanceolata]|uniref:remorin family protein n=1 Tax=Tasmannia lanceolata TaxID=3420 RepID=UPI004064A58D
MEYERIHKVQTGVISPSKLRLKLLGPHNHIKTEGGGNSSRTSPSKLKDLEYVKHSLLAAENSDFNEEGGLNDFTSSALHVTVPNLDAPVGKLSVEEVSNSSQGNHICSEPKDLAYKEITETGRVKIQNIPKGGAHQVRNGCDLSVIYPVKSLEEDSADYDSGHDNASSSSFEFHKGERTPHNPVFGHFSRPVPSKWNDAEKWIVNRQIMHSNLSKKTVLQSQGNRQAMVNWSRVAPEATISDQRVPIALVSDTKRLDSYHPTAQIGSEKFSFVGSYPISGPVKGINGSMDQPIISDDVRDLPRDQKEANQSSDTTTIPTVRSVSMRDMGTEMTPMTSQEPSRTGTPVGATTPIRSPNSSLPSTPRRAPAPSPVEGTTDDELGHPEGDIKRELSEKEMQLKTRREIVSLGVQLGKMNIAAWASKYEKENVNTSIKTVDAELLENIEFETRATAWEEAEKSKHAARYKREEIKIQAWESHQKAKLEAEMRRIEAQVEQMKTHAQAKMMNKLAIARQRSEEKRAAAESRRNQQAAKTSQQGEYIRQTGRIPSSNFLCCSCFP